MVYLRRLGVLMVFSFILLKGNAQVFHPKQIKSFTIIRDTLVLDSLSLVPGSIYFKTFPESDSVNAPKINYKFHALIFPGKKPDSLQVSYKRFPYNFEYKYFHKDPASLYRDLSRPNNPFTINYNTRSTQDNLFQNDGLNKNGNISRGISFGNNQDVVVNSNLNLQVNGKLTPEIDMVLAATDNNIPFQADGTTAQLQEFDKVFIQLNNANTKLVVGDYQLSRPQNSYFMNFYKRAQGLYAENSYVDSSAKTPLVFKTQVSGAVSRGKFSRQVFFGTENNQGPYRLKGAGNEPFIIILSGTEKIYIDGKLMQRGQENDYIIDYNTGELTFTARQIITKDKRIVAEFQYAERNYARSLFFFGEEVSGKKAKAYVNFFSEQDNKNRPLQQTLSQSQKNVLIAIGDTLEKAVFSGAEFTEYTTNNIFYRITDSVVNNFVYPGVYVNSMDSALANYILKFSYVGPGKGNYNQISTVANGRVYQWVAPNGDSLGGSYEPVIPLVTPKQNQMLTGGFSYSLTADHVLSAEGVYTKNDINRFSTANKDNDVGSGVKIVSRNQTLLRTDSLKQPTKFIYNLNYEFLQKRFQQVERFRSIEFDRDWNRPLTGILLNDQSIASAEVGIVTTNGPGITYAFNLFNEGKDYEGIRHNVIGKYQIRNLTMNYSGSYLNTSDKLNLQKTQFYRHKTILAQRVGKVKFTYSDEFENNQFRKLSDNQLLPRAYQFWEWEGSVSNADSSKNNIKVFYRERRDKLNYGDALLDSTFAKNIGMQASVYSIKNNPFSILITYRNLQLVRDVSKTLVPDNTLLNRLEYNPRYFKGFITASVFYETGYGLENKKESYYLEVAPGLGQYAWNDYNGNGIKELGEFEKAQFSDQARFIVIYTPTNQYVKVLQNQLSISANIRPSTLLNKSENNLAKFASRWMFQTALRLDNKINDNNSLDNYNPFAVIKDSLLIAANNNVRHSVFFNQTSAVFGADYTYINNKSRLLQTNGSEDKVLQSHEVKWRINFLKAWAVNSDNVTSLKQNSSEFSPARNYLIKGNESEQRLIFQPNTVFRTSVIYKYGEKKNRYKGTELVSPGFQTAYMHTFAMELKYNQTEKGSLTGRVDFIKIKYNDLENSSIAYEMLNGLSIGDNFTWELTYQRNLNNNIQVSINYNGRKTPNANAVHLGGATIRAFF